MINFGAMAALSKQQIKNTEDMNQSNMRQIFMKEKAQLIIKIYSGVANHEHQQQPVTG